MMDFFRRSEQALVEIIFQNYRDMIHSGKGISKIREYHNQTIRPVLKKILRPFLARKSMNKVKLKTRLFNMRFRGRLCLNL